MRLYKRTNCACYPPCEPLGFQHYEELEEDEAVEQMAYALLGHEPWGERCTAPGKLCATHLREARERAQVAWDALEKMT